jgi:hypothetical protein
MRIRAGADHAEVTGLAALLGWVACALNRAGFADHVADDGVTALPPTFTRIVGTDTGA